MGPVRGAEPTLVQRLPSAHPGAVRALRQHPGATLQQPFHTAVRVHRGDGAVVQRCVRVSSTLRSPQHAVLDHGHVGCGWEAAAG